jgi:RecA/RadA recombinase
VVLPVWTARIPATTAANEAAAVMEKERVMLRFRYLAQQGETMTGDSMRKTEMMAISKGVITKTFIKQ